MIDNKPASIFGIPEIQVQLNGRQCNHVRLLTNIDPNVQDYRDPGKGLLQYSR